MDKTIAEIVLGVFGFTLIVGIFWTKTPGFGKYTNSILLLTSVLLISSLLLMLGLIEGALYSSLLFAITGYAGGLIHGAREKKSPGADI